MIRSNPWEFSRPGEVISCERKEEGDKGGKKK